MPLTKKCQICDNEFKVSPSKYEVSKYCSRKCYYEGRKKSLFKDCAFCGKPFKVDHYDFKVKKYCSKKCHNESMKKTTVKNCAYCGKEIIGKPSEVKNRIYCSRECKREAENQSIPYVDLYRVYVDERKTTRECAEVFGVSKHKISDALKYYKIPIRSTIIQRKGDNHHIPPKEELKKLYFDEYKSMEEIANMFNVDASAVGWWMKKYSMKARKFGAGRKSKYFREPTKDELLRLYVDKQMIGEELSLIYHCSQNTIFKYLHEFGIESRPAQYNGRNYIHCKDGHIVRSRLEQIVDDYLFDHNIIHDYEKRLPKPYGRFMCDFYCLDTYIEIWGLKTEVYLKRRKKKENVYEHFGLNLLSIEPDDFRNDTVYEKLSQLS